MSPRNTSSTGMAVMVLTAVLAAFLVACSGAGTAPSTTAGVAGVGGPAAGGASPAGGVPAGASGAVGAGSPGCSNPVGAAVGAAGGPNASILGGVLCQIANLQPCSMLKPADVQALFSVPLATTKSDLMGQCDWPLTDPDKGEGLSVFVTVDDTDQQASVTSDIAHGTPVSGVGDNAGWEPIGPFPRLAAVKGQATCELTIGGGDGQLSVPTSGKNVFAEIEPAALPGFIKQFGALCTEIFTGLGA